MSTLRSHEENKTRAAEITSEDKKEGGVPDNQEWIERSECLNQALRANEADSNKASSGVNGNSLLLLWKESQWSSLVC
jgi:hypothetical protein